PALPVPGCPSSETEPSSARGSRSSTSPLRVIRRSPRGSPRRRPVPHRLLRAVLAAADAAPGDVAVIRVATDRLLEAGKLKTASRVLTKARFLNSGNRELVALGERTRFE